MSCHRSPHPLPVPRSTSGIALAFLACLTLLGCLTEEIPEEAVIRPVLVYAVEPASAFQERSFPARAQAGSEAVLSFKVAGQIRELYVSVGERVRSGQPIAVLDDKDLRLQLLQAEAGYAEASARNRKARTEYDRTKILHENEAASDNQLDAAQTNAISARANLRAQAQGVALAKAQLGYTALRAPTDGLIASVPVEVNENVQVGDRIVTLNSGGLPEVAFTVPESLIGSIERGQPATVRFTTLPNAIFPAEVVEIGVGSGRTAFPVTARLLETNDRIRSGMVAEVTVQFSREDGDREPSVVVPAYSVAEDSKGRFTYVAVPSEDGLASIERRDVEIGPLSVAGLEINQGLEVGDQVVIAGLRFVEPGMTVRILER